MESKRANPQRERKGGRPGKGIDKSTNFSRKELVWEAIAPGTVRGDLEPRPAEWACKTSKVRPGGKWEGDRKSGASLANWLLTPSTFLLLPTTKPRQLNI